MRDDRKEKSAIVKQSEDDMSTNFYTLAEPVTRIDAEWHSGYRDARIWIDGRPAGLLVVKASAWRSFIELFAGDRLVATRSWGGVGTGVVVTEHAALEPHMQLISEYGELTTVADLRAAPGRP